MKASGIVFAGCGPWTGSSPPLLLMHHSSLDSIQSRELKSFTKHRRRQNASSLCGWCSVTDVGRQIGVSDMVYKMMTHVFCAASRRIPSITCWLGACFHRIADEAVCWLQAGFRQLASASRECFRWVARSCHCYLVIVQCVGTRVGSLLCN